MRTSFIFAPIFIFLIGCSSEIDKCVDAQVRGWQSSKTRAENTDKSEKTLAEALALLRVEEDKRTKEQVEADARIRCLRVGGKN